MTPAISGSRVEALSLPDLVSPPALAAAPAGRLDDELRIETVGDAAGFEALRADWTELLEASGADGVFLTWEWLFTWWKHLGRRREPILVVVRRGRRLVAVAPLARSCSRRAALLPATLEFLGSGRVGSDYLDLLVRAGERGALEPIADQLERLGVSLDLRQLPSAGAAATQLSAVLERRGWSSILRASHVCPYVDLAGAGGWEGYLASLGASHRANLRRRLRKLEERFQVGLERVETAARLPEALDVLLALHQLRWQGRGGSDALDQPELVAFHREFAALALARGWLRLYVLRLDGRPVASLYGFRYRDRFLFYQSGFDPAYAEHSVGLVTMALTIRAALEEGVAEYDLLHGAESYKFLWANRTRELARLELFPPSLTGRAHRQALTAARGAKRRLRRWLAAAAPAAGRSAT